MTHTDLKGDSPHGPLIHVGIRRADELRIVFHTPYTMGGEVYEGEHTFRPTDGERLFVSAAAGASFTICKVVIGIGFHWEQAEDQTFEGALRLVPDGDALWAVNVVPVETYLTSVISSEMSATSSLALLQAHAVISRSWASLRTGRPAHAGAHALPVIRHAASPAQSGRVLRWYDSEAHTLFDVCADDHCQRYQGIARQTCPAVREAVESTRGLVLTYGGEVCDTRFSKCCGGRTETFETCWAPVPHPYLQSVECPYCDTRDPRVLAQVLNDYDRPTADFYRWRVEYTTEELSALVERKSGIRFGRIKDLVPVARGASGRIMELRVEGDLRTVTVGKELEIRKWLSDTHLYSSAFSVEKTENGFVLHGKGWGHGVGLCQIGAAVMGEGGFTYRQILGHYYRGADLTKLW